MGDNFHEYDVMTVEVVGRQKSQCRPRRRVSTFSWRRQRHATAVRPTGNPVPGQPMEETRGSHHAQKSAGAASTYPSPVHMGKDNLCAKPTQETCRAMRKPSVEVVQSCHTHICGEVCSNPFWIPGEGCSTYQNRETRHSSPTRPLGNHQGYVEELESAGNDLVESTTPPPRRGGRLSLSGQRIICSRNRCSREDPPTTFKYRDGK